MTKRGGVVKHKVEVYGINTSQVMQQSRSVAGVGGTRTPWLLKSDVFLLLQTRKSTVHTHTHTHKNQESAT